MTLRILLASGMLLAGTSMAFAQTTPAVRGFPDVKVLPVDTTPAAGAGLRHQLTEDLTKAGYQDIKMQPEAFLIQAKNKAGDPVTMLLSPDSLVVFTAVDAKGHDAKTAAATPAK